MQEIWKPVPNFDFYEVSNMGRVRSFKSKFCKSSNLTKEPKMIKFYDNGRGYNRVCFHNKKKKLQIFVHHLVLTVFVSKRPPNMFALHKNDIQTDNRLQNLYWGTIEENQRDMDKNNRRLFGEKSPRAKLKNEQVLEITRLYKRVGRKTNSKELAEKFGVRTTQINRIMSGKIWKRTTNKEQ